MKKFLAILMASLMVLSLAACGSKEEAAGGDGSSSDAKIGEGRTLVVGVWGAEQEELVREYVVKPFEEETGATVELILTANSMQKLITLQWMLCTSTWHRQSRLPQME